MLVCQIHTNIRHLFLCSGSHLNYVHGKEIKHNSDLTSITRKKTKTKKTNLLQVLSVNKFVYCNYELYLWIYICICSPYLLPATSKTCSSVAFASSAGSLPTRLSLSESTLRLAQPPNSDGTLLKRFRSTFRLVSFFSFPRELGRDYKRERRMRLASMD